MNTNTNTMPDDDDAPATRSSMRSMDVDCVVARGSAKDGWCAHVVRIGGEYGIVRSFMQTSSEVASKKGNDMMHYTIQTEGVYECQDAAKGRQYRVYRIRDGKAGYACVGKMRATEIVRLTAHRGMSMIAAADATAHIQG